MPEVTRDQTLSNLQDGWGTYVDRFRKLSPEAQTQFLRKEGYTHIAGLLGHVAAWWQEGEMVINSILKDPGHRWASYNIDAFNAQAIQRFSSLDEVSVVDSFELARVSITALVAGLHDEAFKNKKIASWLYAVVIEHLQDHDIA